jgi:hypothetical protein
MKFIVFVFSCICFILCSSCSQKEKNHDEFTYRIKVDSISKGYRFEDLIEDYKYIKLETNTDCLLGEIKQVEFYESKIFILTEEIYCFNLDGKFLFSINQKGRGPSEFIQISNFSIFNGIIYLTTPGKLLSFRTETGEFVNSQRIEYPVYHLGFDGEYTYIDRLPKADKFLKSDDRLMISNLKTQKPLKSFFPEERFTIPQVNQFYGYNGSYYFIDSYYLKVYRLSKGSLENYIFFDFGEKNPKEQEVDFLVSKRLNHYKGFDIPFQLEYVFENSGFIKANLMLNNKSINILYDKKTEKTLAFELTPMRNDKLSQIYTGNSVAVHDDYFCSFLTSDWIRIIKSAIIEERYIVPENDPDYQKHITILNSDISDNPILFLYKFKERL